MAYFEFLLCATSVFSVSLWLSILQGKITTELIMRRGGAPPNMKMELEKSGVIS